MDNFLLPLCQINTNKKIVYFCLLRIYAVMNEWLQLIAAKNFLQKLFSQKIEPLKLSLEVPFLPSCCSFRPVQLTENDFVSFITDDFIIFS